MLVLFLPAMETAPLNQLSLVGAQISAGLDNRRGGLAEPSDASREFTQRVDGVTLDYLVEVGTEVNLYCYPDDTSLFQSNLQINVIKKIVVYYCLSNYAMYAPTNTSPYMIMY